MEKQKKKAVTKKKKTEKNKIKDYALQRIDRLSWLMGEKSYSSREELYDR